jgi:hypothetical protein
VNYIIQLFDRQSTATTAAVLGTPSATATGQLCPQDAAPQRPGGLMVVAEWCSHRDSSMLPCCTAPDHLLSTVNAAAVYVPM